MPNPTRTEVHVDTPLTNLSEAFIQAETDFIADRVFPRVPVVKQSDKFFKYTKEDWFRSDAQLRAPGAESAGSGFRITTDTYFSDVFALHKDIDDQTRQNADSPINLERDSTRWLTQQLLLKKELQWAADFFTTSIWTGSTTGSDITPANLWDTVTSTPIDDITDQMISVAKNTGFRPNKLVIGPEVFAALKNHPDILDRIKFTQRGVVTTDILAGLFDVDEVLVAWAVKNTAAEGLTGTFDFVSGKNALLVYAAPSPGLLQPSGGYTFSWTGLLGANALGSRIKRFRLDRNAVDRIEGEMAFDQKLVGATLGVFFSAVVS